MHPHNGGEAADLEGPERARNASSQSVVNPPLWVEKEALVRLQTAVASVQNYGGGANGNTGARYGVTGTSALDINFDSQALTGSLALFGTGANGAADVDFGSFEFGGPLGTTGLLAFDLFRGETPTGQLEARFYGPTGEELAGPFGVTIAPGNPGEGTTIAGIFAASEQ